jgi:ribose/xylose/arabinose/galactoside ABC-type transport system permease subunit
MIATSRTVSAQPAAGLSLELDIIAAVVIGVIALDQVARAKAVESR